MDKQSYLDGKAGLAPHAGTDMAAYNSGVEDARKAQQGAADIVPQQKVEVPGVAYTLIIVAPLLFLVYPALGLTLYVAGFLIGGAVAGGLGAIRHPDAGALIAGSFAGLIAFFPGLKIEGWASQLGVYRLIRMGSRLVTVFVFVIAMGSPAFPKPDFSRADGKLFLEAIVAAILAHFVFRTLDRLYFPVRSEVRRMQELQAKGLPDQRPLLKRIGYGLLWIIPVVSVLNLIVRLFVMGMTEGREELAAFYSEYSPFVYAFSFGTWLLLSVLGVLPGTARTRKSRIDYSAL